MGRARGVLLRAKKCHYPLSEHDLKDVWDVQDGVVSCPSFNPLSRVQEDGPGARGRACKGCFSLRLCGFAALRAKKYHAPFV